MNVCILLLKGEYCAQSDIRLTYYSHCYVTWRPLTKGNDDSLCSSSAERVICNLKSPKIWVFECAKVILPQWNMFANICELHWKLCCSFWHQWAIESHYNMPVIGMEDMASRAHVICRQNPHRHMIILFRILKVTCYYPGGLIILT